MSIIEDTRSRFFRKTRAKTNVSHNRTWHSPWSYGIRRDWRSRDGTNQSEIFVEPRALGKRRCQRVALHVRVYQRAGSQWHHHTGGDRESDGAAGCRELRTAPANDGATDRRQRHARVPGRVHRGGSHRAGCDAERAARRSSSFRVSNSCTVATRRARPRRYRSDSTGHSGIHCTARSRESACRLSR
jgi:hypothetical protein